MTQTTRLQGGVDYLSAQDKRLEEDERLDIVPEGNIVYDDLVFTLSQDPRKYYVPVVRQTEKGLIVVANRLFFSAAKEARLTNIRFDVISEAGFPGEAWMEQHDFHYVQEVGERTFRNLFLFFREKPKSLDLTFHGINTSNLNSSEPYKTTNCLKYSLPVASLDEEARLIERNYGINGQLRSIDGLKDIGTYKRFF